MKKYIVVAFTLISSSALMGLLFADSNGQQPETPAVLKTTYTTTAPLNVLDAHGTPKLVVEFQPDQWEIPAASKANVDAFGKFLKDHPTSQAQITAYADHTGHGPANATLAQKRADAVAAFIIGTYGIAADRVKAVGQGEVADKAHNITMASRQFNRAAYGTITLLKP